MTSTPRFVVNVDGSAGPPLDPTVTCDVRDAVAGQVETALAGAHEIGAFDWSDRDAAAAIADAVRQKLEGDDG